MKIRISKTGTKRLALASAALGIALGIAGCGSTAPTKPTPTPSASASAKTSTKGLTLAKASSPGYQVQFPLVNCNTLSASAQAAWAPLLAGSSVGQCAPANYLTKYVPQNVTVNDQDPAISQKKANAYGQALINTLAWENWAAAGNAPAVLPAIGQAGGPNTSTYQADVDGFRYLSTMPGSAIFPNAIALIALNASGRTIMAGAKENFALVISYAQKVGTFTVQPATGQSPKTVDGTPFPPGIYDGTATSSSVLGTYLLVDTFSDNCSAGTAAGLCEAAGAS